MAKITKFRGYQGEPPIPKPDELVEPNVVTVQDGVPVKYPGCEGIGVRVVHPSNPRAPAENLGMVVFFVPPHVVLGVGSHHTEECYVILKGRGDHDVGGQTGPGERGDLHPSAFLVRAWCREHGR